MDFSLSKFQNKLISSASSKSTMPGKSYVLKKHLSRDVLNLLFSLLFSKLLTRLVREASFRRKPGHRSMQAEERRNKVIFYYIHTERNVNLPASFQAWDASQQRSQEMRKSHIWVVNCFPQKPTVFKRSPSQWGVSRAFVFQGGKDLEVLELFTNSPVSSLCYGTDGKGLESKQFCLLA